MNYKTLEQLAKTDRWQIIYNRSKEINGLQLFNNTSDLSCLQIMFLYFLSLYSMLYQDLNSNEEYISEDVINDELRTEAYLLLRKELKDNKKSSKTEAPINNTSGIGSLIFKRGK